MHLALILSDKDERFHIVSEDMNVYVHTPNVPNCCEKSKRQKDRTFGGISEEEPRES